MLFVRRVHRRLVVVRAVERGGACVGVASIFACAFAAVALFQGRDAMQLVLPILAIGALAGIIWGLCRRPTRFDAVVEADRQLQLSDLLSSAYAQRGGSDPWQRAVVAMAQDRCRSLSPAAVVVHRYGGGAWGGIGLLAALGLTLGLISGVPQDSRARSAEVTRSPAATEPVVAPPEAQGGMRSSATAAGAKPAAGGESRLGIGAESGAFDHMGGATSNNSFTRAGNDGSDGERAGQTAASGEPVPRPVGGSGNDPRADATLTAGGGAATAAAPGEPGGPPSGGPAGSPGASVGTSGGAGATPQARPWSSPSWADDRAAAGEAVRSGRVPDAYRDVVGEYFRDVGDGRSSDERDRGDGVEPASR